VRSPAAATITLLADITAATTTAADHFLNGWNRTGGLDIALPVMENLTAGQFFIRPFYQGRVPAGPVKCI